MNKFLNILLIFCMSIMLCGCSNAESSVTEPYYKRIPTSLGYDSQTTDAQMQAKSDRIIKEILDPMIASHEYSTDYENRTLYAVGNLVGDGIFYVVGKTDRDWSIMPLLYRKILVYFDEMYNFVDEHYEDYREGLEDERGILYDLWAYLGGRSTDQLYKDLSSIIDYHEKQGHFENTKYVDCFSQALLSLTLLSGSWDLEGTDTWVFEDLMIRVARHNDNKPGAWYDTKFYGGLLAHDENYYINWPK